MALVVGILLALFVVDGAWQFAAVAAGAAIEFGEAGFWWRWSHRRQTAVGIETLIGDGWIRVQGELWRQRGGAPGERVRIREVEGLTLVVDPVRAS